MAIITKITVSTLAKRARAAFDGQYNIQLDGSVIIGSWQKSGRGQRKQTHFDFTISEGLDTAPLLPSLTLDVETVSRTSAYSKATVDELHTALNRLWLTHTIAVWLRNGRGPLAIPSKHLFEHRLLVQCFIDCVVVARNLPTLYKVVYEQRGDRWTIARDVFASVAVADGAPIADIAQALAAVVGDYKAARDAYVARMKIP